MKLSVTINPQRITVDANPASVGIGIQPSIARDYMDRDPYEGEYVITPGRTEQVLNIDGKRATADIIVQAIPSNYGLITWNGSTITVS